MHSCPSAKLLSRAWLYPTLISRASLAAGSRFTYCRDPIAQMHIPCALRSCTFSFITVATVATVWPYRVGMSPEFPIP
ncbi:hypothetical protein BJX70DRAFT_352405 [Aspergillus crustosus]